MIIRTSKIIVKLEAGLSEQIPLVGLNMSVNGEFSNWTVKVKLKSRKFLKKKFLIFINIQ